MDPFPARAILLHCPDVYSYRQRYGSQLQPPPAGSTDCGLHVLPQQHLYHRHDNSFSFLGRRVI
jgi:hypothetical protein